MDPERGGMEKNLLAIFLILFIGRLTVRYVLEQFNMKNLQLFGGEVPPVFAESIDLNTINKTVRYTFDQSRLESKENLAGDITELAVLFLLLPPLATWLNGIGLHLIGQALLFFTILALINAAAGLPFNLYHTFVLEKKYGFSTITWKLWLADLIKSLAISAVLVVVVVSVLMIFVSWLKTSWWFWGWVFFSLFQMMLLWLYPVLIAPLFNRFVPIQDEVLKEKVTTLLAKAGFRTSGIYQVDEGKRSKHTNAYFTGIGKTKRIVLYDTLLSSHTHEEILSILAHEIGHWVKKHIIKQLTFMILGTLILFYGIYLAVNWPPLFDAFHISPATVYIGFFLVSLYLAAAGFFLKPLALALMRRFEREADRIAFDLTGSAGPMIHALVRLARDNLSNLHPHPWYVRFHYSHPPLIERIEYLKAMDYKKH